jgi:uncharacterized protein YcbK (DUF882 family)
MVTREQYMMGRDTEYPTTEEIEVNAARLLHRVRGVLAEIGLTKVSITSGYRPGKYNKAAGGAAKSAHVTGEAVDLADYEDVIKTYLIKNPIKLDLWNLYMEDPSATPTWCHLQTRPTKSGNRIFKP